jgi:hypothetical protein
MTLQGLKKPTRKARHDLNGKTPIIRNRVARHDSRHDLDQVWKEPRTTSHFLDRVGDTVLPQGPFPLDGPLGSCRVGRGVGVPTRTTRTTRTGVFTLRESQSSHDPAAAPGKSWRVFWPCFRGQESAGTGSDRVCARATVRVWHVAGNEEAAGAVICGKASKCGISGESAVRHIAGGALRQRPWQQNPSAVRHGSEGRPPLSSAPRRQTATPSASSSSTFAGSAAEPLPECFGVGGGAGSASSVIWPRSRICIYISNSSCRGSIRPSSLSSMLGTVCTATACSFGA